MKLYTEEQLIHAVKMARSSTNIFTTPFLYDKEDILEHLTPIQLPSDEEIEKYDNHSANYDDFQLGAKWMREQILNQIK